MCKTCCINEKQKNTVQFWKVNYFIFGVRYGLCCAAHCDSITNQTWQRQKNRERHPFHCTDWITDVVYKRQNFRFQVSFYMFLKTHTPCNNYVHTHTHTHTVTHTHRESTAQQSPTKREKFACKCSAVLDVTTSYQRHHELKSEMNA